MSDTILRVMSTIVAPLLRHTLTVITVGRLANTVVLVLANAVNYYLGI